MFLAVDAFLLFVLLQTRSDYEQLPKETVQKTVQILQKEGIQINEKIVPIKRAKNQNILMQNRFNEPKTVAEFFLGTYETKRADEANHEFQFESEAATLTIQDTFFVFESKKNPVSYGPEEGPNLKKIQGWLKKFGLKPKDFVIVNGRKEAGLFVAQVIPMYKNMKIYGISMNITADKESILTMEGHCFLPSEAEVYDNEQLLDITAILVNLAYQEDQWPKAINKIESGFFTAEDYLDSREIAVAPIYVITDQAGHQKYFDARLGNEIE